MPPDEAFFDAEPAAFPALAESCLHAWGTGLGSLRVLALVFYVQTCRRWSRRAREYAARFGPGSELAGELMASEPLVLPSGTDDVDALLAVRHLPGLGRRIQQSLAALEEANAASLGGLFGAAAFEQLDRTPGAPADPLLGALLVAVAQAVPEESDVQMPLGTTTGAACESLLRASGPAAAQASAELCRLLAELVDPVAGEDIAEASAGAGLLLAACARHVRRRAAEAPRPGEGRPVPAGHALFGHADRLGSVLARLNLFVHDEGNHWIGEGDGLRHPLLADDGQSLRLYDAVVGILDCGADGAGSWPARHAANDPWGRFERGVPPAKRPAFAELSHVAACLKPQAGRAAVVVPQGVLFRGGVEGRIRRRMLEEALIETVVALPRRLFAGRAAAPALLVMRRPRRVADVLFVDASAATASARRGPRLTDAAVTRIVAACSERRARPGFARLVPLAEIERHDFNLHVPRYVMPPGTPPAASAPHARGGAEALASLRAERAALSLGLRTIDRRLDALLEDLRRE